MSPWRPGQASVPVPADSCDLTELLDFALSYEGCMRLGDSPSRLEPVVAPVLRSLEDSGKPPEWAGIDLLRGALFYVQRMTHHWGDVPAREERQMRTLLAAIRTHARGADLVNDDLV